MNPKKYVTFDQAMRLRDKSFDVPCKHYFDLEYKELTFHIGDIEDTYKNSEIINGYGKLKFPMVSAPSLQDVVDWLLTEHQIWVYSYPVKTYVFIGDDEYYPPIVWVSKVCSLKQINFEKFIDADNGLAINHHYTPDDAISAALDFILAKG